MLLFFFHLLQTHLSFFARLFTNKLYFCPFFFFYLFFLLYAFAEIEANECTGRSIVLYFFSRTHLNKKTLYLSIFIVLQHILLPKFIDKRKVGRARLSLVDKRRGEG